MNTPYFRHNGEELELRIPLDRQQQKAVCQFIKAIPDDEGVFAEFIAESGYGVLDRLTNPKDEGGKVYVDYLEATPEARLEILTRLHTLGWVGASALAKARRDAEAWRRDGCPQHDVWADLKADIRGAIQKGGRSASEIDRLNALLQDIEQKHQPAGSCYATL